MLLGDLIARFCDEAVASETLLSLGDLALTARVLSRAAESNMSTGELAAQAVHRFVDSASDDEWLTLFGRISRADDPGRAFLHHVLSRAGDGLMLPRERT
jgi:hypothetical protein